LIWKIKAGIRRKNNQTKKQSQIDKKLLARLKLVKSMLKAQVRPDGCF